MKTEYNRYISKFSSKQVKEIRDLYFQGYALRYIARKFDCNANAIWHRVFDLNIPKMVTSKIKKHYLRNSKLTEKDVRTIRELAIKRRMNAVQIGRMYGLSQTAALSIINGKTFRWIAGVTKKGKIELVEYNERPISDQKGGPKIGSKQKVKPGVLLKYSQKYNVMPCTICRWIKKGKLKVKKSELTI